MLTTEAAEQLATCKAAISSLEKTLSKHLVKSRRDEASEMTPLGQANWYLTLCQAVSALYLCHMRLSGLSPEGHPHAKDLERLQLYRKKVQKVESEKWLSENKRSLAVDVSAANRFISHAIPELTPQQHEALRLAKKTTVQKHAEQSAAKSGTAKEAAEAFLGELQSEQTTSALGATGSDTQPAKKSKKRKLKQQAPDGVQHKGKRQEII